MVELSGIINNDFLSKCRGTCKILVSLKLTPCSKKREEARPTCTTSVSM